MEDVQKYYVCSMWHSYDGMPYATHDGVIEVKEFDDLFEALKFVGDGVKTNNDLVRCISTTHPKQWKK